MESVCLYSYKSSIMPCTKRLMSILLIQMIPLVRKSVDVLLAMLEEKVATGASFDITKYIYCSMIITAT